MCYMNWRYSVRFNATSWPILLYAMCTSSSCIVIHFCQALETETTRSGQLKSEIARSHSGQQNETSKYDKLVSDHARLQECSNLQRTQLEAANSQIHSLQNEIKNLQGQLERAELSAVSSQAGQGKDFILDSVTHLGIPVQFTHHLPAFFLFFCSQKIKKKI